MRRRDLAAAALLVVLLVGLSAALLHGGQVQRVDAAVRARAVTHVLRADAFDLPRAGAVLLGQRGLTAPLLLAGAVLAARRVRSWRPLVVTVAGLGLLAVTVQALKLGIGRSAPTSGVDLARAGGLSFPSGHAAGALLSYAFLARLSVLQDAVGPRTAQAVAAACAAMAGVGVVVQDYHWTSDVLAGWAVGAVLAVLLVPLLLPPAVQGEGANKADGTAPCPPATRPRPAVDGKRWLFIGRVLSTSIARRELRARGGLQRQRCARSW